MTVLFLIDTLEIGGAEQSILDIVSRFTKFKPVVCHIYPGDTLRSAYEKAGIEVISLNIPLKSKHNVIIPELLKLLEKYKPVLVHATLYRSMMISRKLKRITGLPLVNSFVSNSYSAARKNKLPFKTQLKLWFYKYLDKSTAKVPDIYISNSKTIAESNAKALGISTNKIKVIYRGREMSRFSAAPADKLKAVKEALVPEGMRVLLNVGRLRSNKGQADLILAFSIVYEQFPDTVLLIAGEGNNRKELELLIEKLHLSENVKLLGNRNDVDVLLHIADAFVFSSYYEGLPGSIVEAMMAGRIIIASAIPENMECVNDKSALFFPPGDVQAMAKQISAVLSNRHAYTQLGVEAMKIAQDKFDIYKIAAQYESAYAQLLES